MKLSVLTNSKGVLNKTIDVDADGKIFKTHPHPMTEGVIQSYDIELSDLSKGLVKMTVCQSLCHGVIKESRDMDTCEIVSAKQHSTNPEYGKVSRTKDCIEFKGNHLSMLDHDPDEQCPHAYITPDALLSILAGIDRQWKDAGHCVAQSTSAGLSLDGVPVSVNDYGYHLYFEAKNAEKLKEYMDAVFKLTVIAGHGWIKLSSNGAMNIRSCFDGSVFSPERIDFTAPPTLASTRLTQNRPAPEYYPGKLIDCSNPPEVDEASYQMKIKALKNDPDIIQRSNELADSKASEISKKRNIPIETALQLVKSQIGRSLHADDSIIFKNHGAVSVADVIANFDKYDLEPCADPGEPEYGTSKAIFYANNGENLIIHSMIHGGQNYYFPENLQESIWSFEDAELTLEKVNCNAKGVTRKSMNDLAEDILLHNNFTVIELDVIKSLMKQSLKISIGTLNKVIKTASANEHGTQELTHHDIVEEYIEQHLPKSPNVVGSEGCLWVYKDKSGLYDPFPLTNIEGEIGGYFRGKNCKKGSDYKAIARLVYNNLCNDCYFNDVPYGVAVKSNFIRIADGLPMTLEPYTPEHRQRYKLSVNPEKTEDAPLFLRYLQDTFGGTDYKQERALLQQIMGGLVTGTFNRLQMAVLLIGNGSNGKSVLLEILENMFPTGVKCAISPSDLDKENYRAELLGKVINIIGDLDETRPLKASFKDIVGCDTPISARQLYKEPFYFKPRAGHIFASNHFPRTEDHSIGFYRRWAIINFKNTVTDSKKIPNLGAKIAAQELPQVLAWSLIGAEKLAQNEFKLPLTESHKKQMEKWQSSQDSVFGFLNDDNVVESIPKSKTLKKDAFLAYRTWCMNVRQKPVGHHEFVKRCLTKFSEGRMSDKDRRCCFDGMRIK